MIEEYNIMSSNYPIEHTPLKEVIPNLWVGGKTHCASFNEEDAILHACKSYFAPKVTNPVQYAMGNFQTENEIWLNLIDASSPNYVPLFLLELGIEFINSQLEAKRRVFVHCDAGLSRSPSITLLYLVKYTNIFEGFSDPLAIMERFTTDFYPQYSPGLGMTVRTTELIKEIIKTK